MALEREERDAATLEAGYDRTHRLYELSGIVGAIVMAGWLHLQRPGWRKPAGAIIVIGGLWSLAGLFISLDWLMQGSAAAWLMLLLTNLILAIRKAA